MTNSTTTLGLRRGILSASVLVFFVLHLLCHATGQHLDFGTDLEYGEEPKEPPTVKNETILEIKTNSTATPLTETQVQHAKDVEQENRFPEVKVGAMVSEEDPCENFKSCSDCTRQRQCGWCEANKKCATGAPKGPKAESLCQADFWMFSFCPSVPCPQYKDCKSCLMDPNCGWCASSGGSKADDDDSSDSGRCSAGGYDGPRDHQEDGTCTGNWLHSPTRVGESTLRTAILNLKHGSYLNEVCNAGTMNIQHSLPPPKKAAATQYPVTMAIDPVHGPTFGSTVITVTGLWFGFTPSSGLKAYLGEIPCDDTIWVSESILKCVTPQHRPAGKYRVIVIRDGIGNNDTDAQNVVDYEYREMMIQRISVKKGPTVGGTIMNITGRNFGTKDYNPVVRVGDKDCIQTHWLSSNVIQCVTPPNFGYNHSIVLTINGMEQPESNQHFYFDYIMPSISTTSAKHGPTQGNTTIVVRGENFGTKEGMPVVTIGGVPCMSQQHLDHSEIVCSTPPGVGRHHRVVVTLLDGRYSTEEEFTFDYDPPMIASVTPPNGVTLGRYEVLIAGINFGTGAASPDLTPPVADWTHRRLRYAQKRAGVKDSWGIAWNNTGVGDKQWMPSVEEEEADKLAGAMKNDSNVTSGLYAAAEAAARGDVAAASQSVAEASENAVEKLKHNLKGEALAAAMAVADIVKTSVHALSNVSKTMESGSFSGSALKRVIGESVAAATGKQYNGQNGDAARMEKVSKSKTPEDADAASNYDWKKDRTLVGERMHRDGTTTKLVGPAVFVELAEKSGSNMGTFVSKLPALYSFIDVAENILNAAKARNSNGPAVLDFGEAEEAYGEANHKNANEAEAILPMHNSTNISVDAQGEIFEVDESSKRDCFFTTGCTRAWTPSKHNELWEQKATVMSIEGLKIGKKYKVEITGTFITDDSRKAYGAECPSVTGVGDAHEVKCPTFFTPRDHLPKNKLYLLGKDKTMQKNQRFTAKMTFEGEATSETLSFKSMHSKAYYLAMGPIQMRVLQMSPRMKAPIISEPVCANNLAPDYTMAGPRCIYASIGGQSCLQLEMMTSGMLKCTVPPGVGANLTVAVMVGNQTTTTMGNYERITRLNEESSLSNIEEHVQFTYDKPVVESYYPKSGPTVGGNTITIKGFNFGPDKDHVVQNLTTIVTIGGVPCTRTLWISDKLIECMVPEGVGSRKEIIVTTAGQMYPPEGEACTKCNSCCKPIYYDYNGPIIHNVSPNHGTTIGGTNVAIHGKNFGLADHMPTVTIDGEPCPQIMWKSDKLILCASPGGWGTGKIVKVTVGDQTDRNSAIWSYDGPEVYSVEPDICRTRGLCLLKIRGLNFGHEQGSHLRVTVGGQPCANVDRQEQPLLVNQTTLECVVDAGVGKNLDVKVCVGSQCSNDNDFFSYRRPEVYEIRPRHAPLRGGKVVTITGVGFGRSGDANASIVAKIGGVPCADTRWLSNEQVECTLPKYSSGGFDLPVTVVVANQESASENLFQAAYFSFDAPEIHDISINKGASSGGYVMELSGYNFPTDTTIWFGEMYDQGRQLLPCTKTKRLSSEILKCLVPCGIGFGLLPSGETGFGVEEKTGKDGGISLIRQHSIHLVTNGRRFVQTKTKAATRIRSCTKLPEIFGIKQIGNRHEQGNFATLFCDRSYDLIGNGSFVCNPKTGAWDGKLPRCLKPTAPKPSLPFDVFGTDVSKALAREAQRERSREGTSQAQRYDAEAKKLKEAASVARSSGKPMEAIGLEKQAEGMERLAVKEAKAASSSHAKQIEADAEEALGEAEQLRREGKTKEAAAKEKQAESLKKQAVRVKEMSNVPQPEPLSVMQSISKAEIAAKAQQEAIKRLVQSTIKEQEIERNSSQQIKQMDRQSEMIIAKKEQAQEDIEAASKARKKALEDEQKAAEEEEKASKGAAARAAFAAMNQGNEMPSENDEDAFANALNPNLSKQKNSQIKLLRTKSKELLQAARMKKLQKAYAAAVKKAKGKMTVDRQIALDKLNEEVKRTEKVSKKAKEQESEEAAATSRANAKQQQVQAETKRMVEDAKNSDISTREDKERGRVEAAIEKAQSLREKLPQLEDDSRQQASIREKLKTTINLLKQELSRPNISPNTATKLEEDIESQNKALEIALQKETSARMGKNKATRAGENVQETREQVSKNLVSLSRERSQIYKLRRRILWSRLASKLLLPEASHMRFSDVRNKARIGGDDGLVNVLQAFDFQSGQLLTEYFDSDSPQGRAQDKDMFYRLKGGMLIDIRFDYNAPVATKAYAVGNKVGTKGDNKIIVEGRNFGCRDYTKKDVRDAKDNYTFWEAIEEEQQLTAWIFELDSTHEGKGWNKCLETKYISDGRLECTSPPGSGTNRKMKVTLGGQSSAPKVLFNYDKPVVTGVVNPSRNNLPSSRCKSCGSPHGQYWVTIEGYNFGPTRTSWGLVKADETKHNVNDKPKVQSENYSDKPAIKIGDAYCLQTRHIDDRKVQCLVPPGLGKNHLVSVGPVHGLYSNPQQDKVQWEYERPIVDNIVPRNGQTFGNDTVRITGENFGKCFTYNYVTIRGVKGPKNKFCPPVYPSIDCEPCKSFKRINDRLIECVTNDGVGRGKFVNVKLGNLDVEQKNGLFNYDGPVVTKVRPLHGPTTGGNTLQITGKNFGTNIEAITKKGCNKGSPPTMSVGEIPCAKLVVLSNTEARCTLSSQPGIGKNLPVGYAVGGQTAETNPDPDALYSFDTPEISKVTVLKKNGPNQNNLNAISPYGYQWEFNCAKKQGGCVDADNRWSRIDYSFNIFGKNFGTRVYNQRYRNYRGQHECGFGNFKGSARYISDTQILCTIPNGVMKGAGNLDSLRAFVRVADQSSYRVNMGSSKGKFYQYNFLEYKNMNVRGTPLKKTSESSSDGCEKTCLKTSGCAVFTRAGSTCTYYSETVADTCGKTGKLEKGTTTYIIESVAKTGDCVSVGSLVLGPLVKSVGPSRGTEGVFDRDIRIIGKNFGESKDSLRAKSLKAYYNNEECLKTQYVSDTEVLCKPRQYQDSVGGVVLAEDFEGANGFDMNKWKSTNGKASTGGCARGSPFRNAMVFANSGEIVSNPVNVLRGGKVTFYMRLCGYGNSPQYKDQGVTLSASLDDGATWFVVSRFNTYHTYQRWRKVTINLYNDANFGSHPAASGSTMFKWSGSKAFAIDEVKITSDAVKWPVQVSVNVPSPTPEKNVTMRSLYIGLNKATSYSTSPEFRTISKACQVGNYCHMPAKTDIGFAGFMWRKNIHDDLAISATISTCSSIGQSDMKECLKLFKQDGKKSTFKETSGEWKKGEPIVKVRFAFPVLVKQLRIVHAAENKEECRPKSLTLKFSSGERKVDVDNIQNALNVGNGMFLQYDIKPFAADEISVVVEESQKNCKKPTLAIGQLSLRGSLLSNVNRRASWGRYAWQSCSSGAIGEYNQGRYWQGFWAKSERSFRCDNLHNGVFDGELTIDGKAWATPYPNKARDNWNSRPRGRVPQPEVAITFNRPQDLWAINFAQKHRYHAKSVFVRFFDERNKERGNGETFKLEDVDAKMQNFQLSTMRPKIKKISIKINDVYESAIRAKFPYLYDTFRKLDTKTWIFPSKKAITYDYGLENQVGHAKGIYFSGDAENQLAIHTAKAWPATGTSIVGAVVGAPGKCNDHFIMLSTKPQRKWSFGHSPDILKFAWNCDELAIYQMEEKNRGRRRPKVAPCRATGKKHRFQIKLEQNGIGFTSDACANSANSIVPNNSGWTKLYEGYNPFATKPGQPAQNIYVYFGASQDRKQESKKPYFEMIKMISAGYGLGEVEVIGQPPVNLI